MAIITFYEKPGCKGNLRQKTLLAAAGHTVQAKSLKTEEWSAERLLAFVGKLPISQWFNPTAPAIKSGHIVPENLSFEHALSLLMEYPMLIRRPLMEVGDTRMVGFDVTAVDAWIGLNNVALPADNIEACVHGSEGHSSCGGHDHDHDDEHEEAHGDCGCH